MILGYIHGTGTHTATDILTGKQGQKREDRGQQVDHGLRFFNFEIRISNFGFSTLCSMPYAPCPLARIGLFPALAINEMEIAGIYKDSGALAHDKHRISPVNGITE